VKDTRTIVFQVNAAQYEFLRVAADGSPHRFARQAALDAASAKLGTPAPIRTRKPRTAVSAAAQAAGMSLREFEKHCARAAAETVIRSSPSTESTDA
jgi:hypothetical protein